MMKRLGVMGGMFDPVHRGHLLAAESALRILHLDSVRLVPCNQPNHRNPAFCTAQQRLFMLHLASAGINGLIVDDDEIRRGGISYTVETLGRMRNRFPDAVLVFILGMDSFASLPSWHQWEQLFTLCQMMVFTRPGYSLAADSAMALQLRDRQVHDPEELFDGSSGRVFVVSDLNLDISSSEVRKKIRNGDSISAMVSPAVERYLVEQKLYRRLQ